MSYSSHKAAPTRAFDHLYDPVFTTSSVRNICRENNTALSKTAPIHIMPVYRTMFTDMPYRARNYYTQQRNPLPTPPNFYYNKQPLPTSVSGMDRAKFFAIPIEDPKTNQINLQLHFETDTDRTTTPKDNKEFARPREIGCQTIYRVSSAQTQPWMPEGVLPPKSSESQDSLEIVHVAHLLEGDNEPGVLEVEVVERARRRRAWERSLPPVRTQRDLLKRKAVLEAFEWEEWVARENKIDELQEMKMQYIQHFTQEQKKKWSRFAIDEQINEDEKIKEKYDKKMIKICAKYQRKLRKLSQEGDNIPRKYVKADLIDEYNNKASDSYAPVSRFGSHPRQTHYQPGEKLFQNYAGDFEKLSDGLKNVQRFIEKRPVLTEPKKPYSVLENLDDGYFKKLYFTLKEFKDNKSRTDEKQKQRERSLVENRSTVEEVRRYIRQQHEKAISFTEFLQKEKVCKAPPEVCSDMITILDDIITKMVAERKSHALFMLVEQKRKPKRRVFLSVEDYLSSIVLFKMDFSDDLDEDLYYCQRQRLFALAEDLDKRANEKLIERSMSEQNIKLKICRDIVNDLFEALDISDTRSVDEECMDWAKELGNDVSPVYTTYSSTASNKSEKSKISSKSNKSNRSEEEKEQLSAILKEVEENLSEFAEDESEYHEQVEHDYISD